MIDPRSDRPLYKQLADLLRDQINCGELAPGTRLPSETTLAQTYGLARPAVRQAIAILRGEALVTTERGYGTRVRVPADHEPLILEPGDEAIARMPSEPERKRLDLDDGVPVVELRRASGETTLYAAEAITLRPAVA